MQCCGQEGVSMQKKMNSGPGIEWSADISAQQTNLSFSRSSGVDLPYRLTYRSLFVVLHTKSYHSRLILTLLEKHLSVCKV